MKKIFIGMLCAGIANLQAMEVEHGMHKLVPVNTGATGHAVDGTREVAHRDVQPGDGSRPKTIDKDGATRTLGITGKPDPKTDVPKAPQPVAKPGTGESGVARSGVDAGSVAGSKDSGVARDVIDDAGGARTIGGSANPQPKPRTAIESVKAFFGKMFGSYETQVNHLSLDVQLAKTPEAKQQYVDKINAIYKKMYRQLNTRSIYMVSDEINLISHRGLLFNINPQNLEKNCDYFCEGLDKLSTAKIRLLINVISDKNAELFNATIDTTPEQNIAQLEEISAMSQRIEVLIKNIDENFDAIALEIGKQMPYWGLDILSLNINSIKSKVANINKNSEVQLKGQITFKDALKNLLTMLDNVYEATQDPLPQAIANFVRASFEGLNTDHITPEKLEPKKVHPVISAIKEFSISQEKKQ